MCCRIGTSRPAPASTAGDVTLNGSEFSSKPSSPSHVIAALEELTLAIPARPSMNGRTPPAFSPKRNPVSSRYWLASWCIWAASTRKFQAAYAPLTSPTQETVESGSDRSTDATHPLIPDGGWDTDVSTGRVRPFARGVTLAH